MSCVSTLQGKLRRWQPEPLLDGADGLLLCLEAGLDAELCVLQPLVGERSAALELLSGRDDAALVVGPGWKKQTVPSAKASCIECSSPRRNGPCDTNACFA